MRTTQMNKTPDTIDLGQNNLGKSLQRSVEFTPDLPHKKMPQISFYAHSYLQNSNKIASNFNKICEHVHRRSSFFYI